ncbi:MAG: hypothetical protein IJV62_02045, partial [Eggerthellaceae bacterium]|nr:hypothetical protein [Eggerthellaceae bacterium]
FLIFGVGLYLILKKLTSPSRAKYILAQLYILLSGGLTILFLLGCAYAALEKNYFVMDFALTLAAATCIIFVVMLFIKVRLVAKYPTLKHYAGASLRMLLKK